MSASKDQKWVESCSQTSWRRAVRFCTVKYWCQDGWLASKTWGREGKWYGQRIKLAWQAGLHRRWRYVCTQRNCCWCLALVASSDERENCRYYVSEKKKGERELFCRLKDVRFIEAGQGWPPGYFTFKVVTGGCAFDISYWLRLSEIKMTGFFWSTSQRRGGVWRRWRKR